MHRPQHPLPHLAFFERLTQVDEGSVEFRAATAGLVTLRLCDAWVTEGPHIAAAESWEVRAVRDAIAAMDAHAPARALLTSILDAMDDSAPLARVPLVLPRLMAYARTLAFGGEWPLAVDVYRTVLAHAHPLDDADVVVSANLLLGAALRTLARWDEAARAYDDAGEVALLSDDIMSMLKARIGEANLSTDLGNLPEAERILDETIADADQLRQYAVRAIALQDRATVAHRRGDYDEAGAMQFLALKDAPDDASRDRVLADLAATFFEIGLRSAARDANLLLAATAQEQFTRWHATINLMELAATDRQEPVFEQYRRDLSDVALPPMLAAWYYYYVGQGYRMFDRIDQARTSLERALEFARRHQLNQVAFHAETALGALSDGETIVVAPAPAMSPLIADAVDGVRAMREAAGIRG